MLLAPRLAHFHEHNTVEHCTLASEMPYLPVGIAAIYDGRS